MFSFASEKMEENVVETETRINGDFTNIPLESGEKVRKHKKPPKRILHFSDGVLEEYSSSDEEKEQPVTQPVQVDPKTLSWLPWIWFYIVYTAGGTLSVADKCGEKLAWFFGITSPKYQAAIDEYYKLKAEEEQENASMASMKLGEESPSMEEVVTEDIQIKMTHAVHEEPLQKY